MHHDYTIASLQNIFNKYPQNNRPDKHLIDIIKIILENNDFEFNGETFLQCLGCSMETRVGPSCANIHLLEFDEAAKKRFPYPTNNILPLLGRRIFSVVRKY